MYEARTLVSGRLSTTVAVIALLVAILSATGADAQPGCPAPPPPVKDLDVPRFYGDKEGSVVDAKRAEAHKQATAPLTTFLRQVCDDADKAWLKSKPDAQAEAGECAVTWLAAWAKGKAWLGVMKSQQAEYQRKWDLAGVALAYLKVRRYASPVQRTLIEPWLIQLADAARSFFDSGRHKRNNHWYWLGLGVGAVALSTDSARYWDMARGIMQDAAGDIAADGTLAMELERKGRALHYHAFAAMPLVVLTELAQTKGEDWYALGDGALHRLVRTILEGLARLDLFAKAAGATQDDKTGPGAGWFQLYERRFPDRGPTPRSTLAEGHRWLGGRTSVLLGALKEQ